MDTILPVEITIYADKSFTFILKTPPAAVLVKKEAGIEKGSGQPNRNKVGSITAAQVKKIAEIKMPDLNCDSSSRRWPWWPAPRARWAWR